ncbi:MAG: flagellar assembly factor FliW [Microbacteriaceae bacterium]|jgi:flagellar assembly factor FliW|nr:flagellar assembly factor FliW [Microbacteriaceae bacterium]
MTVQINLTSPLSGLAPLVEYELSALDGAVGVYVLRSTDRPEIRLYVVDSEIYMPDFRPDLGNAATATTRTLLVVTPNPTGSTVNLLAPILIDTDTRTGAQIILADDIARVRTPLRLVG